MLGMQTIQKYKETIIFVSCASALVGTVLVLQKATTPSRHRRRAPSSASRAGTATARSANHGVAGTRSRSSSRPRTAHTDTQHHTGALAGATVLSAKVDATAAATERSHGARSRDASQAHGHRHHTHPRTAAGGAGTAAATSAVTEDAAGPRTEPAHEAPTARLTVEAVLQHKHALGTANALQDPAQTNTAGARVVRRVVSSSGYRVQGGSGTGEEGGYYRSASNAATVGSQAPCPPITAAAVAVASSDRGAAAVSPASPRSTAPVVESPVSAPRGVTMTPLPAVPVVPAVPRTAVVSATQTSPRWFGEDRGTQTEPRTSSELPQRTEAASATPDRWMAAALAMSPIMPAGDGNTNEDTSPINYADLGWTPLREAVATEKKKRRPRKSPSTETPAQPDLEPAPFPAAAPAIPRIFLQEMEAQVRRLVEGVAKAESSASAWMLLYTYLAALPSCVRMQLATRNRCNTSTVARLVESRRSASEAAGNRVEGEAAAAVAEEAAPSLGQEVLHAMQTGLLLSTRAHFERRGQEVAYVAGAFDQAAAWAAKEATTDHGDSGTCRDEGAAIGVDDAEAGEDGVEGHPQDEATRTAQLLAGIMAHVKNYAMVLQRPPAASPPHDPDETRTPPRTTQTLITTAPYALSTPPSDRQWDASAVMAAQLQRQQEQLSALLSSFVQLRQTPLFQAVRHTPQHALFACDFIELAAAAERVLDRTSPSPDSTLLLQVPTTQKRVMADKTEVRDTSVDTNLSGASGSSPLVGAGYTGRHSVRVRTPMKPSIRYPIQRVLSNSPSPAGLSSRRGSEMQPMADAHCYPSLSAAHAEDRNSVRVGSIDTRRGSERPAELWAS